MIKHEKELASKGLVCNFLLQKPVNDDKNKMYYLHLCLFYVCLMTLKELYKMLTKFLEELI